MSVALRRKQAKLALDVHKTRWSCSFCGSVSVGAAPCYTGPELLSDEALQQRVALPGEQLERVLEHRTSYLLALVVRYDDLLEFVVVLHQSDPLFAFFGHKLFLLRVSSRFALSLSLFPTLFSLPSLLTKIVTEHSHSTSVLCVE